MIESVSFKNMGNAGFPHYSFIILFLLIAMTLKNFSVDEENDRSLKSVSEIGSMLFTRGVSGTRVVTGREEKIFQSNHVFKGIQLSTTVM